MQGLWGRGITSVVVGGLWALLLGCEASAPGTSGTSAEPPRSGSSLGVDGVGFRRVDRWDASRPYRLPHSPRGLRSARPTGRPMQVGVWYPARIDPAATPMTVAGYHTAAATENALEAPTPRHAQVAVANLAAGEWVDAARLDDRLATTTQAHRDAAARSGPWPVVLYAPGSSASWNDNWELAERLAARGYVVLASRSRGLRHPDISWDVVGVESEVRDLEFLYGLATEMAEVDASRVAVIGRSWGAVAAVTYAHRNPEVDAFVSLDGTLSYDMDQLLEAFPQLPRGESLQVPTLIALGLERSPNATPIDHVHYFDDVDAIDVHELTYARLQHAAFSSSFLDRYFYASGDEQTQASLGDIVASFELMTDDVAAFLDAHVAEPPPGWLDPGHRDDVAADVTPAWADSDVRAVRSKRFGPRLPGFDDFSRIALDFGLDEARALHERVVAVYPEHRMFNVWSLNRLIAEAIARGEYDAAIELADFTAERYPERSQPWIGRARAQWLSGDAAGAAASLQQALAIAPDDRTVTSLLARIEAEPDRFAGR